MDIKQSEKSETLGVHFGYLLRLYDDTPEVFTGKDVHNIKTIQQLVPSLGFTTKMEGVIENMFYHYIEGYSR